MAAIKDYYWLAKPGIVYGNAIAAIAGFFFASRGQVDFMLFAAMLVGISLVMASACVFNNYIDKDIDRVMARTKKRALVSGKISDRNALIYGSILGLLGVLALSFTNMLTVLIGIFGFIAYVILYGIGKRKTVHGTVIGSISGAVPPVVGYCAVTNTLDLGAWLLFLILVLWQMPHFYAIAMFRRDDYAAAKVPVLSVVEGMASTKRQIVAYTAAFVVSTVLLFVSGYAGYTYLLVMLAIGLYWLWVGLKGLSAKNDAVWAKKMFGMSLVVLIVFSATISVDAFLP